MTRGTLFILKATQARDNCHGSRVALQEWGCSLRFGEETLNEDGEGVGGALFGGNGEVRRCGADAFGLEEEERGLYLPM